MLSKSLSFECSVCHMLIPTSSFLAHCEQCETNYENENISRPFMTTQSLSCLSSIKEQADL